MVTATLERQHMGAFDFSVIIHSLPYLWQGLQYSIQLTCVAMSGGILLGTILALMRLSNLAVLRSMAIFYVNFFRSIPLILAIFWIYFLAPMILQWITHATTPPVIGPHTSAYVTFTLFEAAFYCEIIRAGIQGIPKAQVQASYALGMTHRQSLQHIVLPQAFRNMLPVLLTQTIILFQDTSLVYVLSVTDFLGAASKIAQRDGRLVEMYSLAAVVYFVSSYGFSRWVSRYGKHSLSGGSFQLLS